MSYIIFGFVLIATGIGDSLGAKTTTYNCFDVDSPLQLCNFEKTNQQTAENIPSNNLRDHNNNVIQGNQDMRIIFKLMRCIPSRLLFPLRNYKAERYSEVPRALKMPFKNFELDATHRGVYINKNHHKSSTIAQIQNYRVNKIVDKSLVESIRKRNNMLYMLLKDSKNRKNYQHWNKIDVDTSYKKNRRRSNSDTSTLGIEFPYDEAIPFDPKKHWMLLHHRPEDIQFVHDVVSVPKELDAEHEKKNPIRVLRKRRLIEFPYAKAIPFDPKKHNILLNNLEGHREVPLVSTNLLRLKSIPSYDVRDLTDSTMLNHFRKDQQTSCEISTIRKEDAAKDERIILLDDWKKLDIKQRLVRQFRHTIPTRTMKNSENDMQH